MARRTLARRGAPSGVDAWLGMARDLAYIGRRLGDVPGNVAIVRAVLDLTDPDRPLGRLLASPEGGSAVLARGGALDRLLASERLTSALNSGDGLIARLTEEGGTLDQIDSLNATMESVRPILDEIGPRMQAVAASPLGELASLFPARRRRGDVASMNRDATDGRRRDQR